MMERLVRERLAATKRRLATMVVDTEEMEREEHDLLVERRVLRELVEMHEEAEK